MEGLRKLLGGEPGVGLGDQHGEVFGGSQALSERLESFGLDDYVGWRGVVWCSVVEVKYCLALKRQALLPISPLPHDALGPWQLR